VTRCKGRPLLWVWVVLAILAVAVEAALLWIAHRPIPRVLLGDEGMYWRGAEALASGAEWAPESLWPPLQFHFLGWIVAATGGSRLAVEIVQTLLLVAAAALLYLLTKRLTDSRLAAGIAAGLALIYPPLVASAHHLWPEPLHLALFLGLLWILEARADRPIWLVVAGVLLGLALLTKSLLLPFVPVLLLLPLMADGRGAGNWRRRLLGVALVAGAAALTLAPTLHGNRQRGAGVLIADSGPFNLWVGLNDSSRRSFVDPVVAREYRIYRDSAPTPGERDAIAWRKSGDLVREQGAWTVLGRQLGRQYFRLFDKDSFFTVQLPGGVQAKRGHGYVAAAPAVSSALRYLSYGLYALILVGAAIGVSVSPLRGRRGLQIALAFVVYNLLLFLVLHVKSRYRLQFLPFLLLWTGCAAAWLAVRLGLTPDPGHWRESIPLWAWPLAAGLLFLAF